MVTFKDLLAAYPDVDAVDEDEEYRLDCVDAFVNPNHGTFRDEQLTRITHSAKARGKGPPKKRRTKEGKRHQILSSLPTVHLAASLMLIVLATIDSKKFGGKKRSTPTSTVPEKTKF